MSRTNIALLLSSVVLLLHPNSVAAQVDCGSLIQTDGTNTREIAITDCDNPFGANTDDSKIDFLINGTAIENGDTLAIDFSETIEYELRFATNTASILGSLYKKSGDDYIADLSNLWLQRSAFLAGGVIDEPGEYALVISAEYLSDAADDLILSYLQSIFLPIAHASVPEPKTTIILFTIEEAPAEEVPQLSDLLLQYEPILQFHEDEDYFPMNVDVFVEGSGLWDSAGIDEVLIPRIADPVNETNELTLEYIATTTDTSNWYISFSSDEPGEFDLEEAKLRYDALVEAGKAVPTYYAHQSEHSYVDDLGIEHDFIVLQYWYFYAMNDWGDKGGFNDHEGDWESVFVFLDKDTEEPLYVAFSAHHNDGDPSLNPTQYESVRSTWQNTRKNDDQVISYVALGAHAMYSFQDNHRVPSLNPKNNFFDETSSDGKTYESVTWEKKYYLTLNSDGWVNRFKGKFGADKSGIGTAGIEGPLYNQVSGTNRFLEPLQWAGIDKITGTQLTVPEKVFNFGKQGVQFAFSELLPIGTEFSSAVYDEFISFGKNINEINLIPRYWEFSISEPNGSFLVETTLSYNIEEITALGINEALLGIYFYNEETDEWEQVPSSLNLAEQTISFFTDHFSIYTIGENNQSQEIPEENIDTEETVEEKEVDSSQRASRTIGTRVNRANSEAEVLGITTSTELEVQKQLLLEVIRLLEIKLELLTLSLAN